MLEYNFEQGEVEQKIIEQSVRFGTPLPDRIKNAPELLMGLELYYLGFLELNSCRQLGFGIGPISTLAVFEYCVIRGIEGEQFQDFLWMIERLDQKYIKWSSKNVK